MPALDVLAYAKLNLSLDVLEKRPDGYHEMRMVMQTVDLCDRLRLETGTGKPLSMRSNLGFLPADGRNLAAAAALFFRALGAVGAMYFLALNTPVTDLTMCLGRLHVPRLLVELMELIYRFIFVLSETASNIRIAQESRLGYQGLGRSLSSLGTLISVVFLRAWRKADRVYTALESRGYANRLATLSGDYRPGRWLYPTAAGVALGQLLVFCLERRVAG